MYDFLLTETDQHQGFFETENWIRQYAHDYNIPLYGSYDPTCIKGLDETDFFDGLHCKGCGIAKFFPGVPQVLQDVEECGQSGYRVAPIWRDNVRVVECAASGTSTGFHLRK